MKLIKSLWLALLLTSGVWLCHASASAQTASETVDELQRLAGVEKVKTKKEHRIEVGDRLRVKIYPEDEYIKGAETDVSSEGAITLALLGRVQVEGSTILEAEQKIVDILSKDYLVNPVVVIEVVERIAAKEKRSVAVLGQVQKPGNYELPLDQRFTLLQAISNAGGFTDIANVKRIKVIRKGDNGKTSVIRANAESILSGKQPDIELEPEDVIHVGESFF